MSYRGSSRALIALAVALSGAAGCNAVLGIHEVDVTDDDAGPTLPPVEDSSGGDVDVTVPDEDGSVDDGAGGGDTAKPDGGGIPQPNAACLLAPLDRPALTFTVSQTATTGGANVVVAVTDTDKGFTNITVRLCTPSSPTPSFNTDATVKSPSPPYKWEFDPQFVPRGKSQISFLADPAGMVYETAYITIP